MTPEEDLLSGEILRRDIPGLPPRKIRGEWNPEYFIALFELPLRRGIECLNNGTKIDFPFEQFSKLAQAAAKRAGFDPDKITDRRTDVERAEDAVKMLMGDPERILDGDGDGEWDKSLRAVDRLIEANETGMNDADRLCYDEQAKILKEEEDAAFDRDEIGQEGREHIRSPKAWRRRIARVLRLRHRAKTPIPNSGVASGPQENLERPGLWAQALEAAHFLRFMVFAGRRGVEGGEQQFMRAGEDPAALVFYVSEHHAKFAVSLWIHRTGAMPVEVDRPEREDHVFEFVKGKVPYQGSMQVMPYGHHKTEMAIHYGGLEMGLRPRMQAYYVHAKHDRAKKGVAAIKRFLDRKDGIGKRYLSLFPLTVAKNDNDATHIRIKLSNPPKSPTWTAAGVDGSELGGDSDFQIWDDVVPQSDVTEETTRKRRFELLAGTFLSRQRGRSAFTMVIGTFWHHGDALMTILSRAKDAARTNGQKGMMFGVLVQRCGGPKATPKTKEWQALCPKIKDVFELKLEFGKLGPTLYSAAFMADPIADAMRKVKKLRLYAPCDQNGNTTPEHAAFLVNSVKYISLDPAATKDRKSDKAGIVYGGIGDIRVEEHDGIYKTEKRVRLFSFHEISATQSDLVEYVTAHARHRPVDYVMAEAVSGFYAIIEMFRGFGIDAIPVQPRGQDKGSRLIGVAPILEDASAEHGFRAICEWPGVWEDGVLVLDPAFQELATQVLDYGVCVSDHALDALTYLLGYLSPELGIGRGIVTEQVRRVEREMGDPRLLAMYKSWERSEKLSQSGTQEEFEDRWMKEQ